MSETYHNSRKDQSKAQALSQPATTGRSMGRRTIGLASSGLGRVWPVGISFFYFLFDLKCYPLFSPISWYPIVSSYYLVSSLQLLYGLGRDEGRKPCVLRYTTQPSSTTSLTQHASNPEASCTNVSEETQCTWRPGQPALRPARHRSR